MLVSQHVQHAVDRQSREFLRHRNGHVGGLTYRLLVTDVDIAEDRLTRFVKSECDDVSGLIPTEVVSVELTDGTVAQECKGDLTLLDAGIAQYQFDGRAK